MNLLCPNCQKMLQVPEQFAGQLMKCPLCTGTFTVPTLPSAAPPAPPPPLPERKLAPTAPPPPQTDGFAPPPSAPPEGYQHVRALTLSPRFLAFIAPLSLILVFVLLFFPWVGMYPGGDVVATQNGWDIALGWFDLSSENAENAKVWVAALRENRPEVGTNFKDSMTPTMSVLMFVYLLLYFVALAAAILSVAISLSTVTLPAGLAGLAPWRALILAGLVLLVLGLLLLQGMMGFELESKALETARSLVPPLPDDHLRVDAQKYDYKITQNLAMLGVQTTFWFRLVLWLHALAFVGALLDFWVSQRGARPAPKIEFVT